jgi:hypothetical protein
MRANEIYQKSRKEKETIYKRYKEFNDLFAEIIQSEVKFYGSIKKIPFNVIVETSKVAHEYIYITKEGYGAKRFKGSIVNKFQKICKLSDFNSLENIEQYKKLIEINSKMNMGLFNVSNFKYIFSNYHKDVIAKGKIETFWENKNFEFTLNELKKIEKSYDEILFMNDTVKFIKENEYVNFGALYLKVIAITEEKKEGKVKVEWQLSKKGQIYDGSLDIPGSLKNLRKGKKLNLYGKEISYKDYLKGSKGKIKVNAYYGFPQHVAKWVKAQILSQKAMNCI